MVLSPVSQNLGSGLTVTTESEVPRWSEIERISEWSGPLALPAARLFGTDGIRGRVGDILTPALAFQVGFWAGTVLKGTAEQPVLVGQDSRNSSQGLAKALVDGLSAAGLEVWHLGLCPTPAVAYLTQQMQAAGGVMISASHNPPEDNGIKFFGPTGAKLPAARQAQIESLLRSETIHIRAIAPHPPSYDRPELVQRYIESLWAPLYGHVDLSGMRVVLDLAWGAAAQIGGDVFRQLGAEVICLHDYPDGDRINVNCGSTHLGLLQAAVKAHGADLGVAFDGDADRALAVDGDGRVVDGDYILYLWGMALQHTNQLPNQMLISTVMANLGFERAWQQQGGLLVRTAVGDQHVLTEMVARGAMLGGEQSGHILCPYYGVSGDGLMTALHLAALVQRSGLSLRELRDQSFQTFPQLLCNVCVDDRDRRLNWQNCSPLQRAIAQAESAMGDQGRVLVRASGTEPLIRVMVEAADADLVQHWTQHLTTVVRHHLAA